MVKNHEDVLGKKFGMLLVMERPLKGSIKFKCICDCGKEHFVAKSHLKQGSTRSCGCNKVNNLREGALRNTARDDYVNPSRKHGLSRTPTHNAWSGMKQRCNGSDPFTDYYYIERGIKYDPSWEEFENFYKDMGVAPEGTTLDRIDVNGHYCKENCRWTSFSEQSFNTRKQSNNTSGRTGVVWSASRNKWIARMNINKKQTEIGAFLTFEEACKCREEAELEMYGYTKE